MKNWYIQTKCRPYRLLKRLLEQDLRFSNQDQKLDCLANHQQMLPVHLHGNQHLKRLKLIICCHGKKKKKKNVTFFTHKYDLSVILICMNLNIVIYNFYNIISIIIHYIFFSSFDITKQLFPSCKVNIKLSTLELTTYDVHVI